MMTVDGRTPVIVGVGQVNHTDGDSPEPVELIAEAARRAADDAGVGDALTAVQSVGVVRLLSRGYPDPGALVADRLGIAPARTVYTTAGGQTPQVLVNRTFAAVAAGELDVALVCGGESWRTRNRLRARGERSPWSNQSADAAPTTVLGSELHMTNDDEAALGFTDPVQAYPMFEHALRRLHGRGVDEQRRVAATLWARFSEVAAENPYAVLPRAFTPEEIATPGPSNRMIGHPYTKLMNSNSSVDQAAALLICSVDAAHRLGVSADRQVFLHGSAEADDVTYLSNRIDLASSPAIRLAGAEAMRLAGVGADDIAHVDLYSCFPSAVQVAGAELGFGLDRSLTVTGGLTFAGGPWNAYVLHAIATLVARLRDAPETFGLCSANGGLLTKHAIGVYSCRPPDDGQRVASVQAAVDRLPRRQAAPGHDGTAIVETYTVMHDREGAPERAFVFGLLDDARRTLATSVDSDLMAALVAVDPLGRTMTVRDGTLVALD